MKKVIIALALLITGLGSEAQVGFNCQYVPGIQLGSVKVKTDNDSIGRKYRYSAGLPLMMIDRIKDHWYFNIDLNALYYATTAYNKANSNKIKIAKTEGGYFYGRVGYLFGKGDQFRIGGCGSLGRSVSNLDSSRKAIITPGYTSLGAAVIVYKKFGKLRVSAKLGYEKIANKKFITKGSCFYFESTFAYMIKQKYGLSVMPCYYGKKFAYMPSRENAKVATNAKVTSLVFRFGLTKFF